MNELITIVIAAKNEEKYLPKLLESLAKQTYTNIEVLIYDGNSTDKTKQIITTYQKKDSRFKYKHNPKEWHVYAFNKGIEDATGKYWVLLGAHSEIPTTYVHDLLQTYNIQKQTQPKLAGVGGIIENQYTTEFGKLAAEFYGSKLSGSSSFRFATKGSYVNTVVFGLYNINVLKEVNGFDERFTTGQDYELNLRIREVGYALYQNPSIVAKHYMRSDKKKFLNQVYRYAAVKGILWSKTNFRRFSLFIISIGLLISYLLLAPFLFFFLLVMKRNFVLTILFIQSYFLILYGLFNSSMHSFRALHY